MPGGLTSLHCEVYVARRRADALRRQALYTAISWKHGRQQTIQQQSRNQQRKLKRNKQLEAQQQLRHQQPYSQQQQQQQQRSEQQHQHKLTQVQKHHPALDQSHIVIRTGDNAVIPRSPRTITGHIHANPDPPLSHAPRTAHTVHSLSTSSALNGTSKANLPIVSASGLGHGDPRTNIYRYPKNIATQRLLSKKPINRFVYFSGAKDFTLVNIHSKESNNCTTSSKQSVAKLQGDEINHGAPKFRNPFKFFYELVKRTNLSLKIKRGNSAIAHHTKSTEEIKSVQSSQPRQGKPVISAPVHEKQSLNPRRCNKKTVDTNNTTKPQGHTSNECGSAFQCCNCGRVIVVKKRQQKKQTHTAHHPGQERSLPNTKPEEECRSRSIPQAPGWFDQFCDATGFNSTMTSYKVFSWTCFLAALILLCTAFQRGALDSALDFRAGPLKEFYTLVGLYVVAKLLWWVLTQVWKLYDACDETLLEAEQWAVITGCTNGIGKEYARQLAAMNLHVILISRDSGRLMQVAREIANEFHVRTMTIQADFSSDQRSMYDEIESRLEGFDIGVLVNNVGISHEKLDLFHLNTPDALIPEMIHVNMLSMVKMTRIILPGMLVRRRGVIINISSGYGRNPSPLMAFYGATKTFIDQFTRSLDMEYGKYHIVAQSVTPYIVSTNMTMNVPESVLVPSPEKFVRSAIKTIGVSSRTHGFLPHSIMGKILDNVPSFMRFYYMKLFRRRADKFIAQKKGQKQQRGQTSID